MHVQVSCSSQLVDFRKKPSIQSYGIIYFRKMLCYSLFSANNRRNTTWNISQCETVTYMYLSLSVTEVSVFCPAIFWHYM